MLKHEGLTSISNIEARWVLKMFVQSFSINRRRVAAQSKRILLTACLTLVLSISFVVSQDPMTVYAAPDVATGGHQDRRPDRERPVATATATPSQGSSGSGTSQGASSGSSSSDGSSSQARPRLVRH